CAIPDHGAPGDNQGRAAGQFFDEVEPCRSRKPAGLTTDQVPAFRDGRRQGNTGHETRDTCSTSTIRTSWFFSARWGASSRSQTPKARAFSLKPALTLTPSAWWKALP